jgi:hypothetical protein
MTSTAHADQLFQFVGVSDSDVVYFANEGGVYAGGYQGKLASGTAFGIFCTDFTHNIANPDSYSTLVTLGSITNTPTEMLHKISPSTNYYYQSAQSTNHIGGLTSAMGPLDYHTNNNGPLTFNQRASAVSYLTDTYLNATTDKNHRAGAQIAIWDIIQDGGDGLAAGSVVTTTSQNTDGAAAVLDATTIIANVEANNALGTTIRSWNDPNTYWIQSPHSSTTDYNEKQSFTYHDSAFTVQDVVPEPAFYQMSALLLLGGAGLFRLRRKR